MPDRKCDNCVFLRQCKESRLSLFFFVIGIVATVSLRVVTVAEYVNPLYGKIAWYIGVLGFFVFFVYKFRVDRARYLRITQAQIMEKITRSEPLSEQDRRLLHAILCSLSSNKDRINYFLIFVTSALALIAAVYLDIFR